MTSSLDDKLDFIENADNPCSEDQDRLIELAGDGSPEVRMRAIEALSLLPGDEIILKAIRCAIVDSDELVRLTSLEGLDRYNDLDSLELIRGAADDSDWMVRGQAAITLAKFGDAASTDLARTRLMTCENEEEKIRYAYALAIGSSDFSVLTGLYDQVGYRARCAIVNYLTDAIFDVLAKDKLAIARALEFLDDKFSHEQSSAVLSTIKSSIKDLKALLTELAD